MSKPIQDSPIPDPNRRAVLRVLHDVDERGRIICVQLEPLPDAPHDDVAIAAYQAARRCHPWLVDDATAEREQKDRAAAVESDLLRAAGALVFGVDNALVPTHRHEELWRGGYRAALEDLRSSQTFNTLRNIFESHGRMKKSSSSTARGLTDPGGPR